MEISYSYEVQQALLHACEAAEDCHNASVGTEHLLIGILRNQDARLTELLRRQGITEVKMKQEVQILFGFENASFNQAVYTSAVKSILKDAELMADDKRKNEVEMDDLCLSLLKKDNNVALELLKRSGVAIEELIEELNQEDVFVQCRELRNLNQTASLKKGKAALREKEIAAIIQILMRMEKSNCVLTGPAGVGKTAIVEELAARIVKKQVPDELKNCIIAELNVNQMVAGTKYRGEFEGKIQNLLHAMKRYPQLILFVDELHLIVGAGKAEGSLDIASVLKPVLSRSGVRVIGATTSEEYEQWIAKDKALQRRFVRVEVQEPDEKMTLMMLKEKSKDLQNFHHLKFQKGLLKQCVSLSSMIFPHLKFPDKAIDLLDMSCSLTRYRSMDTVTVDLMKEAASALTRIPVSIESILEEFHNHLKDELSPLSIEKLKTGIQDALKYQRFSFVSLSETEYAVRRSAFKIAALFNVKHTEIHASFFSHCAVQDWVKSFSSASDAAFRIVFIQEAEKLGQGFIELCTQHEISELLKMTQGKASAMGVCLLCGSDESGCGFKSV